MEPNILALISDLYGQIVTLRQQNGQLADQLQRMRDTEEREDH